MQLSFWFSCILSPNYRSIKVICRYTSITNLIMQASTHTRLAPWLLLTSILYTCLLFLRCYAVPIFLAFLDSVFCLTVRLFVRSRVRLSGPYMQHQYWIKPKASHVSLSFLYFFLILILKGSIFNNILPIM